MLIDERLIVELKAVTKLHDAHVTQTLAYLKATGIKLGLLLNFHEPVLKDGIRRIIL